MTNREFAEKDREFRAAYQRAFVPEWKRDAGGWKAPTMRQASKYRRQRGLAYEHRAQD